MKFTESVIITFVTKIFLIAVGVLSSIIVARYLGPSGRGVFAVLGVISGIALQFGNLGLHASNTYFVAKDRDVLSKVFSNTLWVGIIVGIIISAIIIALAKYFPDFAKGIPRTLLLITLLVIPFQLITLLYQNIILGLQRVIAFNVFEIMLRVISLIYIIFLLIILKKGVKELVIANAAVGFVVCILYLVYAWRIEKFGFTFDFKLFKKMLQYGIKAYIAALLAFMVIRSDMLLVNYFLGVKESGVYSITVQLADLIYMLPITIGMMLFPKISYQDDHNGTFTMKVTRYTVAIMVGMCVIAGLISKPAILLFYGEPFRGAIYAFRWILPGVWALSIQTIFANYFASRGMPIIVIISPGMGLVVNLILNLKLIPAMGINGAAISSSLSYALMFLISLMYFLFMTKGSLVNTLFFKPHEIREIVKL
ncbi:MAG: oligosaccharide flippase family protein [bacterium]